MGFRDVGENLSAVLVSVRDFYSKKREASLYFLECNVTIFIQRKGKRPLISVFPRFNRMQCHRNPLKKVFLIFVLWSLSTMFSAGAGRVDNAELRKHSLETYERMAFVNSDGRLVKMTPNKDLPINVVCFAQNCNEITNQLKPYIPNRIMQVFPLKKYVSEMPINIFLLSEEKFSQNQKFFDDLKLELQPGERFDKDVAEECVSFSIFKEHEIRKIIIIAANFSSWKKTVSCIIVQLTRGSGLAFTYTFDELWSEKGALASSDENNFHSLLLSLGRMMAIQFQPATRPGMTRTEFEAAIDNLSSQDLTGGI
jgi:hypothetical protein